MSTNPFKLLLFWNNSDGSSLKSAILPPPDASGNFTATIDNISIPLDWDRFTSSVTPTAVWDSSNGEVFLGLNLKFAQTYTTLAHFRPGSCIGQLEYIKQVATDSNNNDCPLSVVLCQSVPYAIWVSSKETGIFVSTRQPNWNTSGMWNTTEITYTGGTGSGLFPASIRIGNEWVLNATVSWDASSRRNSRLRLYCIDPVSLQRATSMPYSADKSAVVLNRFQWNTYSTEMGTIDFFGRPGLAVSGSTTEDRKLHVFLRRKDVKTLWYFTIALGLNGLPKIKTGSLNGGSDKGWPLDRKNENQNVPTDCASPMSTLIWNQRVYVYYANSSGKLEVMSKQVTDGGTWSKASLSSTPDNISLDSIKGGLTAVLVPKDFSVF